VDRSVILASSSVDTSNVGQPYRLIGVFSFCDGMCKVKPARGAFTLVELMIVVMILAIMAMVVVPRFVSASGASRSAALADQIRIVREAVNIYRAQHGGQWPGVDSTGAVSADANLFFAQLTSYTDVRGETSATKSGTHLYGPYLLAAPANPISGLKTVTLVSATPTPDGATGWFYQPATGRLWPNLTASDADGKAYIDY
jgi:general secretion pathway protein G